MVQTNLNPTARASATNIAYQQQSQNISSNARPEKIAVIGNYQDGKTVTTNTLIPSSGSPDDIGIQFGFGSPLHRMAQKLFPINGNGSKVDTYFIAVNGPGTGAKHTLNVNITGTATSNFVCYLRYKELEFEAAADIAGKVATNAQLNPAKDPRGIDVDIFNKVYIPFTITKGMTEADILASLVSQLNENIDIPFVATVDALPQLVLTSKWSGSTSVFEVDFVDTSKKVINASDYGITFAATIATAGAGLVDITNTLKSITEEFGITRVVSQFNDTLALDAMKNYFQGLRDGLIAQYVLCYTGMKFPQSGTVPGTVDLQTLISLGDSRRDDAVNILIAGDFGDLRSLDYKNRDILLKAGISNLEPKANGSYRIGDLATFYHPIGNKNPLYKFDRNVTLIGNTAYDLLSVFKYGEDWKSIVIVAEDDVTDNPVVRKLKDIQAAVNTRLELWGKSAWIANVAEAQKNTVVAIDPNNPDRININPGWSLSSVGRIFDVVNFVSFYFG